MSEKGEEALLNDVANRYRDHGYEVLVEPESSALPFDLGGYRPDLITREGDLTAIIEVKTQAQRISFDQLRPPVEEVKRHQGWRFVLITADDFLALGLPSEGEEQFSWEELVRRVEDARRLSGTGENQAAYLILWIALERMTRFRARCVALPVDRLAPSIVIRQLYSQGELNIAQFESLLSCQKLRNRIVHGFPASDVGDAVTRLSALILELIEQWSAQSC